VRGSTKRIFDNFGNELFPYGLGKMPTELQRKYNVDLDIYGEGPDRKPYYQMTGKAA